MRLCLCVLALLTVASGVADAQRTGSSFGRRRSTTHRSTPHHSTPHHSTPHSTSHSPSHSSGSFSGSSHRSTGGSSMRSWSGSRPRSSSGGHASSFPQSERYTGPYWNVPPRVAAFVIGGIALLALFLLVGRLRRRRAVVQPAVPATRTPTADVSALMMAFDSSARRPIQHALDDMARSRSSWDSHGLFLDVVRYLASHGDSWVYLGAMDSWPAELDATERTFQRFVSELRARYREELVRSIDGELTTRSAPTMAARAEEGEGLCVVSLVVECEGWLEDLAGVTDPNRMLQALQMLTHVSAENLVSFEVIWSPATEEDRLSSAELEVLYPELRRVEGAVVGRMTCGHCQAVYALELGFCPSCGAPPALSPKWS